MTSWKMRITCKVFWAAAGSACHWGQACRPREHESQMLSASFTMASVLSDAMD